MFFLKKKRISYKGYNIPDDEAYRISLSNHLLTILFMVLSGIALSAAFPPLNYEIIAFAALAPLIVQSIKNPASWRLFFYGYIWSLSWSLCSFFWLREINFFIPFALSAIIGLWGGVFAILTSFIFRWCLRSEADNASNFKVREKCDLKWYKIALFAIVCGSLFIMLEYIRIGMFPWNFIGVSQYKMLYLIQIVRFTGIWGVSFLIVAVNAVIAVGAWYFMEKMRGKDVDFKGVTICGTIFAAAILLICIYGYFKISALEKDYLNGRKVRFGLVQGDISQRRSSNSSMAQEALDIYLKLSHELAAEKPDIIVWPETAVPYPYYGGTLVSARYRSGVYELTTQNNIPLLAGTLDFIIHDEKNYDMTNSAFLIGNEGRVKASYAKIHRVPFGEFIPFSAYLPQSLLQRIGMGRDLAPGTDPAPLEILPGVRAGMAICYESIFAVLSRREANLGANMFLAINNDAWYPESSEPEQHCANAIFRAVECGLPSLRSGNNGASALILPSGRIAWQMDDHLLARSRAKKIVEVTVKDKPQKTFYCRFGDCFLFLLFVIGFAALIYSSWQYFSVLKTIRENRNEV